SMVPKAVHSTRLRIFTSTSSHYQAHGYPVRDLVSQKVEHLSHSSGLLRQEPKPGVPRLAPESQVPHSHVCHFPTSRCLNRQRNKISCKKRPGPRSTLSGA